MTCHAIVFGNRCSIIETGERPMAWASARCPRPWPVEPILSTRFRVSFCWYPMWRRAAAASERKASALSRRALELSLYRDTHSPFPWQHSFWLACLFQLRCAQASVPGISPHSLSLMWFTASPSSRVVVCGGCFQPPSPILRPSTSIVNRCYTHIFLV